MYFEAFSFWSKPQHPKGTEQDRQAAITHIKQLKDVLKRLGYTIHKHGYSYTVYKDKLLGLAKPDNTDHPKYIDVLFTLAHEVGHTLQWDEAGEKERFQEFFREVWNLEHDHDKNIARHLHKMWYELDAWVKGLEFIPTYLKPAYKKYAMKYAKSYMDRVPKTYYNEMLLRNLLYKLNYDENRS